MKHISLLERVKIKQLKKQQKVESDNRVYDKSINLYD